MIEVGRMGEGPAIAAGPLTAYQAQFPGRYVAWDWGRQMFEVREVNLVTGVDERVALVFWYDTPEDEKPVTADELALMIESNDRRLVKYFRPFDMRFVESKLLDWAMLERHGVKGFVNRIMDANRKVWERKAKESATILAEGWGELRSWMPVLANYHETGKWDSDLRIKSVRVGVNLKEGAVACRS